MRVILAQNMALAWGGVGPTLSTDDPPLLAGGWDEGWGGIGISGKHHTLAG